MIRWDEWRGSLDGRPTMWIKALASWRGFNLELHKIVAADDAECFHSHSAKAIRMILWKGYVEQIFGGGYRWWCLGNVGIVHPSLCHRIATVRHGGPSYSLWLRFPKSAKVELRGSGWPQNATPRRDIRLAPGHRRSGFL
jgi:hypothetical protein